MLTNSMQSRFIVVILNTFKSKYTLDIIAYIGLSLTLRSENQNGVKNKTKTHRKTIKTIIIFEKPELAHTIPAQSQSANTHITQRTQNQSALP